MYWCSLFIILKYTISKIEQNFSSFLRSSKIGNARHAKIRWESVCLPKKEGGLGLRRFKDSNDANVMKHIWNLFYRKDSLWVAWVGRLYLRQGSLLQLRDRIRPFIRHKVCSGAGTFLWHDFWNSVGPLLPCYGEQIIYDYAIHSNALVAEVIGDGRWNWPIANSADLIVIKNSCVEYPLDVSRENIISWTLAPFEEFSF